MTGLTQPQISNYENETNLPNTKILLKLADALTTSIDYLVRGLDGEGDLFEGLTERDKIKVMEYIRLLKNDNKLKNLMSSVDRG